MFSATDKVLAMGGTEQLVVCIEFESDFHLGFLRISPQIVHNNPVF
jgi:hypothetical protein